MPPRPPPHSVFAFLIPPPNVTPGTGPIVTLVTPDDTEAHHVIGILIVEEAAVQTARTVGLEL